MGPHTAYIAAAYAATVLVLGALILFAALDHRAQRRALAELEARGAGRRPSPDVRPRTEPEGSAAPHRAEGAA